MPITNGEWNMSHGVATGYSSQSVLRITRNALYPKNLKNRLLGLAKALIIDDCKWVRIALIRTLQSLRSSILGSFRSNRKTDFSGSLGIAFLCLFFSFTCEAKVYDCFPFFNELDILELRLNELDGVVDKFVLVESVETFQGNLKPLYFKENIQRFEKFKDKIIHIVFPKRVGGNTWKRERIQRNQIMQGLVQCEPDDLILISDVDEIIRASKIPEIMHSIFVENNIAVTLLQPMYRFYMNAFDYTWESARAISYRNLLRTSPNELRQNPPFILGVIVDCGWHFTSIGGLQKHRLKTESFSHNERNNEEYKSQAYVDAWVQKCTIVKIDDTFPQYLRDNLQYFEQYLYKPGMKYQGDCMINLLTSNYL